MKKLLIIISLLLICGVAYGAPTPTATRPVSYTTGEIVDADDQNSNENTIYNKYNTHDHQDFTLTTNNTFTIGDNTDGDKDFIVDNSDANNPRLRYDASINAWTFSNNGTIFKTMVASEDVAMLHGSITGLELRWENKLFIKVLAGAVEINNQGLALGAVLEDFSIASEKNWIGDSIPASGSAWIYVYAFNDADVASFNFSLTAPDAVNEAGDADDNNESVNKYFTTGGVDYRCVGAVYNGGQIESFFQRGDTIMWDIPPNLTTTPSDNAWSSALSAAATIPAISRLGIFGLYSNEGSGTAAGMWIRPNASDWPGVGAEENGIALTAGTGNIAISGQRICATDNSQQIQYFNETSDDVTRLDTEGYSIEEIR